MIARKKYLPLLAVAAVALVTSGCSLFDDDDGPATGGETMMPDDGDGMVPDDGETAMPDDGDDMMPDDDDAMMPDDGTSEPVAFMAGVDRLYASNRTVGLTDDGTTIVMEDTSQTPSGWSLTVDGKTIELGANNLSSPGFYYKDIGNNEEVEFWSVEGGGFEGDPSPEFDYLNIYGFYHGTFVKNADTSTLEPTDYERGSIIYIVHGTPSSDMPVSGTAAYDGRVSARVWPSDAAVFFSESTVYSGDFDMTASFGETGASVTGSFSFDDVPGGIIPFTVDVTDNQMSVSGLSIIEGPFAGYQNIGVRGAFFGPAAAEVGGVFEGENPTASTLIHGYFAGGQTQYDQ